MRTFFFEIPTIKTICNAKKDERLIVLSKHIKAQLQSIQHFTSKIRSANGSINTTSKVKAINLSSSTKMNNIH